MARDGQQHPPENSNIRPFKFQKIGQHLGSQNMSNSRLLHDDDDYEDFIRNLAGTYLNDITTIISFNLRTKRK